MIDHLLQFGDEPAAIAALSAYRAGGAWAAPFGEAVMPVEILFAEAVYDGEELVTPAVYDPEFWVAITAATELPSLVAMPELMIVTDRAAATAGDPSLIRSRRNLETVNSILRVEPVWAGSVYPWGEIALAEGGVMEVE